MKFFDFIKPKKVILSVLIVSSFLISILTLKNGHNWGDDFAQYLIYAKNIISGRPIIQNVVLGQQDLVPAGYSLLLAPIIFFRGVDFLALKLLTVFFWFGMVWGYFCFIRIRNNRTVWQIPMALILSSVFFTYKQSLSPDIPFAFYVVWAVYCFERYCLTFQRLFFNLFLLLASLAIMTRSAGGFLFVAGGIYCFWILKDVKKFVWVLCVLLGCVAFQKFFVGIDNNNSWALYATHFPGVLKALIKNLPVIFQSMLILIVPPLSGLVFGLYRLMNPLLERVSIGLFVGIFLTLFLRFWKKKVTFLDIAFVCYLVGLVGWLGAVPHPASIFGRYIIPVYGFILYYLSGIIKLASVSLVNIFFGIILFLNVWNIFNNFTFNDNDILTMNVGEMTTWVRENINKNENIMFTPPRALALMTERHVGPIWFGNDMKNLFEIKDLQYKYIITFKKDRLEERWLSYPDLKLQLAWENSEFIINKVTKINY